MAGNNFYKIFAKLIKNKNFSNIIIIILILYISGVQFSRHVGSLNIISNTPLVVFLVLILILLVSMNNIQLGIILTIAYLTTLFIYTSRNIEAFANNTNKFNKNNQKKDRNGKSINEDVINEDGVSEEIESPMETEYQEAIRENQLLEKHNKDKLGTPKKNNKNQTVQPRQLDPNNEEDNKYIVVKEKAQEIIKNIDHLYTKQFDDLNSIIEHRINDVINVLGLVDDEDED